MPLLGLVLACALGAVLARGQGSLMRRMLVLLGFPMSLAASGLAGALPAWAWLLPLGLLVLVYPRQAWGDAPLFPTPSGALDPLASLAPLGPHARLLDAGCGVGDGLIALRRAYPGAGIEGVEWSGLLCQLARWRCPWARVQRGDMWSQSWAPYALVYLFQRPESMDRAWAKACAECVPGSYLVSLEFEVVHRKPLAEFQARNGKTVRLYQVARDLPI